MTSHLLPRLLWTAASTPPPPPPPVAAGTSALGAERLQPTHRLILQVPADL